jgi:hypothetical protein
MKTSILILLTAVFSISALGQEVKRDTTKKEYKNIIGVDVTGILKQVFNPGSVNFYYPYMLTYRRVIKSNAIRFGVGGSFYNSHGTSNDTIKTSTSRNSLNIGLGFEHYCYLGRRWDFYFGVELTAKASSNDNIQSTNNTSSEYYSFTSSYGLSPLLGIVFKISKRIVIATETSYNVGYFFTNTYGSNTLYYPNKQNFSSGIQTTFIPPTALNLRFKF